MLKEKTKNEPGALAEAATAIVAEKDNGTTALDLLKRLERLNITHV